MKIHNYTIVTLGMKILYSLYAGPSYGSVRDKVHDDVKEKGIDRNKYRNYGYAHCSEGEKQVGVHRYGCLACHTGGRPGYGNSKRHEPYSLPRQRDLGSYLKSSQDLRLLFYKE